MSVVSGVSVAHDAASVETVEAAAATDEASRTRRLDHERPVEEAFVLQTCNRAEAYVVTDDPETGHRVLAETLSDVPDGVVRELDHEESLRHLMRVACGLESLVLGEDQILGQVRDAYERARDVGSLGAMLDQAVTKAIHVGERARDETTINEGTVSLATAAVELADREHGLEGAVTLVVGAGEMGSKTARSLAVEPVEEVVVGNRTVRRAEHVAAALDCNSRGIELGDPSAAADADVLVSATSSDEPIIDRETLAEAGETFVVDLARPRDVAPAAADLPKVTHRDLDSLESITERTKERRREAAEDVRTIVDEDFDRLLDQYKRQRADDVIAAMYEGAEVLKRRELDTAVRKLESRGDDTDELREVVESLADALVNQLLAAPTESLREAAAEDDWTTIDTALRLFDPEFETAGVTPDESGTANSAGDTAGNVRHDGFENRNEGSIKARANGSTLPGVDGDDD